MIALVSLGVFVSALLYDLCNARYVRAASYGQRWHAASWSVLTYGAGLVGIVAIVRGSLWLIPPEAAGLFIGSFLGVKPAVRA